MCAEHLKKNILKKEQTITSVLILVFFFTENIDAVSYRIIMGL